MNSLRKTQYLIGQKYISSNEGYKHDNFGNLHEIINRFHLLQ